METTTTGRDAPRLRIAPADATDLEGIRRLRHAVYATEMGQHPENPAGGLKPASNA